MGIDVTPSLVTPAEAGVPVRSVGKLTNDLGSRLRRDDEPTKRVHSFKAEGLH